MNALTLHASKIKLLAMTGLPYCLKAPMQALIVTCIYALIFIQSGVAGTIEDCHRNSRGSHYISPEILTVAQALQESFMVDISNSNCSRFVAKNYGLIARSVCVSEGKIFICSDIRPPYGVELSQMFLDEFNIDRSDIIASLKRSCKNDKNAKSESVKNCQLSDDKFFSTLVNFGPPAHTCFCQGSISDLVFSICVNVNGAWASTAEFEPAHVKLKLSEQCKTRNESEFQKICQCESEFDADMSAYLSCLKERSLKPAP